MVWDGDHSLSRRTRLTSQGERRKLIWLLHSAQTPRARSCVAGVEQEAGGSRGENIPPKFHQRLETRAGQDQAAIALLWSRVCQGFYQWALIVIWGEGQNWELNLLLHRHARQALYHWAISPAQHLLSLLVTRHGRRKHDISMYLDGSEYVSDGS